MSEYRGYRFKTARTVLAGAVGLVAASLNVAASWKPGEQPLPGKPVVDAHDTVFTEDRFPSATACAPCHAEIYREWSVSAHAYAQLSPVLNAMQAKIGKLTNGTKLVHNRATPPLLAPEKCQITSQLLQANGRRDAQLYQLFDDCSYLAHLLQGQHLLSRCKHDVPKSNSDRVPRRVHGFR